MGSFVWTRKGLASGHRLTCSTVFPTHLYWLTVGDMRTFLRRCLGAFGGEEEERGAKAAAAVGGLGEGGQRRGRCL